MNIANPSRMQSVSSTDVLEAAAFALVAERCRQSYVHDLRGGLQALGSAVELLARAAKTPSDNVALAEKAVALARRAMLNHEQALLKFVDEVAPRTESARSVDLGELMSDVLRFIRNDAANRSITFRLTAAPGIWVRAEAGKCRLLVLGLCAALADGLDTGTEVHVTVGGSEASAQIEFSPAIPSPAAADVAGFLHSTDGTLSAYQLLSGLTRQWALANGGGLEWSIGGTPRLPGVLRIHYPREVPADKSQ